MTNLGYYSAYNLRVFRIDIRETGKTDKNGCPEERAFITASANYKKPNTENDWISASFNIIIGKHLKHQIIVAKRIQELMNKGTCNINLMGEVSGFQTSYEKDGKSISLKTPRITVMANCIQVVNSKEERAFERNITVPVENKVDYGKRTGTFKSNILNDDLEDSVPF